MMRTQTKVEYIAFDGTVFYNSFECEQYEENNNFREKAEKKLREVRKEICELLKKNDMKLEVVYNEGAVLCFNEDFEDLGVEM